MHGHKMEISPTVKQSVYAMGALLNMVGAGMAYGYPAILTPALLAPDSDILADKDQTSWLASLSGISAVLTVLIIGPVMHLYGRRAANFCIIAPVLIGWILTSVSYTLPVLFVGRFLHTLASGGNYFFGVCIGEFASPRTRGALLNLKLFAISFGITIIHVCGYFLHWRRLALIPLIPVGISLVITIFWPNTPDWLVSKGRLEEAEIVFFSLRGRSEESEKEIRNLIEETKIKTEKTKSFTLKVLFKHLTSKLLWKPVLLLFCAYITAEFGGRHYFPSYSLELVGQISGDNTKGFLYTYIIDVISMVGTVISFYFVEKFKRRDLILCSGYLAVATLLLSSLLMYLRFNYYDNSVLMWVILFLFALYFFLTFGGTFAVAYILMGELLPLEYRATGSVISSLLSSVAKASSVRITPILTDRFDVYGMFAIFSLVMITSLLYLHYNLPETKKRTLQDIGDYFKGKSPKVRSIA